MDETMVRVATQTWKPKAFHQEFGWCLVGRFGYKQVERSAENLHKQLTSEISSVHEIDLEEAKEYAKDAVALSRDLAALLSCPITVSNAYVYAYITDRGPTAAYCSRSLSCRITRRGLGIFFRGVKSSRQYVASDPEQVIETAKRIYEAIEYDAKLRAQRLAELW